MAQLVQITPGVWVRPERVSLICARNSIGIGKPAVSIQVDGVDAGWGWECETWDAAVDQAAKLAAAVNAALMIP